MNTIKLTAPQLRLLERMEREGHVSDRGGNGRSFDILFGHGLIQRKEIQTLSGFPARYRRFELTPEGQQYLSRKESIVLDVDDDKAMQIRQRQLDELAVHVRTARRQIDSCGDVLKQLGRDGFHNPAMHGLSVEYVKDAERALALLANVVATSGGRP